jgi:tetratricopeptide (TPR) repeat protein
MGVAEHLTRAALAAARDESVPPLERAEMLMEIAMGLQRRPKTAEQLRDAVALYDEALALCPPAEELLAARLTARKGTALQALPAESTDTLAQARDAYQAALPVLGRLGRGEEVAEAEMNLGLVLQHLAGCGRAKLPDAIAAYERALRVFDAARYPAEYAILQNNLATAFLSMGGADERAQMREALAVRCFEQALKVVTLAAHPAEYAMLHNNLGNALQYASSSHALENNVRALVAYDEALKVRTREARPLEHANTMANKANCLWNLGRRAEARACYAQAHEIFASHGERDKATVVAAALAELESC